MYSFGFQKIVIHIYATYDFPKDSLVVQKILYVMSIEAFKFVNGEGDCGSLRLKKWDDCDTYRERTEPGMNALKTKDTWFKFSVFIQRKVHLMYLLVIQFGKFI